MDMVPTSDVFCFFFSYTSRVVSSGLKAQINNPELKVRGLDPLISTLIDKLQNFNQVSNFRDKSIFPQGVTAEMKPDDGTKISQSCERDLR